jgi:NAD(P)-dependent dehydrogenase (short-subunit alcohol dehydrogenase family)
MSEQMLVNKVALVTGAAGGFGRVLVKALAEQGARVCALDVEAGALSAMHGALAAPLRSRVITQVADIADYAACGQSAARAQAELGGLHILVNNAALSMGVISREYMTKPVKILDITPDIWQRFVAVNFTGAWNMTRACIAPMLGQRWGRIIDVTTSLYSMLRGGFQPYGPCKAGLEAMAAAHAKEFAGTGVTVNVVIPGGPADTPMVPEESGFDRKDLVPPEAMGPPIVWLCSPAADVITGHRYIAAHWDAGLAPALAEQRCRAPIAWAELAQNPVWPGGAPRN